MMKPLLLFYLLVIYVLLQFAWWAYLLIDLNHEIYLSKMFLLDNIGLADEYDQLAQEYSGDFRKRCYMVAGEGLVFLSLLVFGIYKTRESFNKEFFLARQQKNFLLSITHEFKSPLAAVKLNLQTLQKRNLNKEQRESVLDHAISETDRIDNLVENALIATRIEAKNLEFQNLEFNYSECVRTVLKTIRLTSSKDISIDARIEDDIFITGDPVAITSLVSNLVENAVKYSPPNSVVEVILEQKGHQSGLTVKDQGPGIEGSERQKIFSKFYRTGNEETRSTKGTGLGLFIVKHVVDIYNGKLEIRDNSPAGTIFEVTLPASSS